MTDIDAIVERINAIEAKQEAIVAQMLDRIEQLLALFVATSHVVEAAKGLDL